ncbi:MAG: lysine--tRNA ligase [Patescibacteria group bacterium]
MGKETVAVNDEYNVRLQKMRELSALGLNPYPARSGKKLIISEVILAGEGSVVSTAGRIMTKRDMGKLTFCHIQDESGAVQIALQKDKIGADSYALFVKKIDGGDIVQVTGERFVTHKGEQSILVSEWKILAKALLPLPEKWHGLTDVEARYRRRYLDLISNKESMRIALLRSDLVKTIRNYFDERGFHEVETPVLQTLYGGALARPFQTHHEALDIPLYLRIAPELYLKRLIVGGFEKVYEVAKCFRNEGIDHNHNPEFTQIEFYWAYADYHNLMDMMEDLIPHLIKSIGLSLKFVVDGQEVDFTPPYPRVTMRALIKQYAKIDIEDYKDQPAMYKIAAELGVGDVDKDSGRGKLIDEIYKKFARPHIVNPIFMIDHPVELSPLAKRKEENPDYVERLQLLCVGGNELCNGFSELNDPVDQEKRFKEQVELRESGDEESMPYDEDYVTALNHGMPPTAGLGMGIDRLVKLLVNAPNLKEVILFPTLKPESVDNSEFGKSRKTKL